MVEAAPSVVLDAASQSTASREVLALVWAANDRQAAEAEEFLRHRLWPYWFCFRIKEVRELPLGGQCPLRREVTSVLASAGGQLWTWVLVAPETDLEAVASCT